MKTVPMTHNEYLNKTKDINRFTVLPSGRVRRTRAQRKPKDKLSQRANSQRQAKFRKDHPDVRLWEMAKARALKNNLEFTIKRSDIVIPKYCAYLGYRLTNIVQQGAVKTNVSLDRIDNTKGYVPGNIEVISSLANRMKNTATPEELVVFAWNVLTKYADVAARLEEEERKEKE